MNPEFFGYRKLVAYQQASEVVKLVYTLLKKFPKEEQFALCSQLRRAAVSITSNIAEGVSRYSYKDKIHFLEIAFGSLMEVMSQLEIATDMGYITIDDRQNIEIKINRTAQLITGLQYSFMQKDECGNVIKPQSKTIKN